MISRLLLAAAAALSLSACVGNPSSQRAAELANLVSRAVACRAGQPNAATFERFVAVERAKGATPEQLAGARSTYVTVSEANAINQAQRPQPCVAEERQELARRMARIRAGQYDGL